jgi:hypothetical protein
MAAWSPAALAFAIAALAAGGCGGGDDQPGVTRPAASQSRASQATLAAADCNLWLSIHGAQRSQLVASMRDFFGGPVDGGGAPGERGSTLTDAAATRLFDSYCAQPFASAFKLYKLYGRAAAMSPARVQ